MNSVLLGFPNSLMTCWATLGNVQSCCNGLVPGVWCNTLPYNPIPHAVCSLTFAITHPFSSSLSFQFSLSSSLLTVVLPKALGYLLSER